MVVLRLLSERSEHQLPVRVLAVARSLVPYLTVFTLNMLEVLQQVFVVDLRLGRTFGAA